MFGYLFLALIGFLFLVGIAFLGSPSATAPARPPHGTTGRSVGVSPESKVPVILAALAFAVVTYPLGGGEWVVGFPIPSVYLYFGDEAKKSSYVNWFSFVLMLFNALAGAALAHAYFRARRHERS
jgi:hypothetical protein